MKIYTQLWDGSHHPNAVLIVGEERYIFFYILRSFSSISDINTGMAKNWRKKIKTINSVDFIPPEFPKRLLVVTCFTKLDEILKKGKL